MLKQYLPYIIAALESRKSVAIIYPTAFQARHAFFMDGSGKDSLEWLLVSSKPGRNGVADNKAACTLAFYYISGRVTGYGADNPERLAGLQSDYTIDLSRPRYVEYY